MAGWFCVFLGDYAVSLWARFVHSLLLVFPVYGTRILGLPQALRSKPADALAGALCLYVQPCAWDYAHLIRLFMLHVVNLVYHMRRLTPEMDARKQCRKWC